METSKAKNNEFKTKADLLGRSMPVLTVAIGLSIASLACLNVK